MAAATVASPALAPAAAATRASPSFQWDLDIHKSALDGDLERFQWHVTLEPALLEARGFNGVLPAHCAARKGAVQVLRFLAARGADLRGRDNGGWTVLHHAVGNAGGHINVLQAILLDGLGAGGAAAASSSSSSSILDVDVRAGDGSTPLLVAVVEGHREAARFLLRCGADPAAANAKGVSPWSHAASFLASLAAKAHLFAPVGRIRKSRTTRDREAIGALVHSDLYRVAALRRLRDGGWGQRGEHEQGQDLPEGLGKEMGVLKSLVGRGNDDVFAEALRYLRGDPEGDEA